MTTQVPDAAFVRLATTGGTLTATMVGPSIRERDASIIGAEVTSAIKAASPGLRWLVLDMTAVEFMPSMGLGMCVDLHNRARGAGGRTILTGLNPNMLQIFKLMKLDKLFKIVDDDAKLKKLLAK